MRPRTRPTTSAASFATSAGVLVAIGLFLGVAVFLGRQSALETSPGVTSSPPPKTPKDLTNLSVDGSPEDLAANPVTLSGRVETPRGEPIAGARVTIDVVIGDYGFTWGRLTAGRDGTFSLGLGRGTDPEADVLREHEWFFATARAPGFRPSARATLLADSEGGFCESVVADDPIVLAHGATVRGRVVDASGDAVVSARVTLLQTGVDPPVRALTDGWGEFDLPIDEPGEGRVRVEDGRLGVLTIGPLALSPDEDHVLGEIRLENGASVASEPRRRE